MILKLPLLLYCLSIISLAITPFIDISFIDELIVLSLGLYGIGKLKIYRNKEFITVILILFLYFLYSIIWGRNKIEAILLDFILFTKPFICFYVALQIDISANKDKLKIYRFITIGLGLLTWIYLPFIDRIYSNTTSFYPLSLFSAVSYLIFSSKSSKDKNIALLFLIPGLFTIRAKFYAEFIMYIYLFYFLGKKIAISFKNLLLLVCAIFIIIYVNWEKITFYFVTGYEDGLARTMLYHTSFMALIDYIPFGSGFGTLGTEAAARYYSPLYYEYGLDNVLGLRPQDYRTSYNYFSDTFYPILAQFGIMGIFFYIKFWIKRLKDSKNIKLDMESRLFYFLFITMAIQNIADNTFTGPLSLPIMMSLGFLLAKNKI